MKRLLVVVEKTDDGFGAWAPEVPGVGVLRDTRAEAEELMRGALALHFGALREQGASLPDQSTWATWVEVS